jgi:hypothetical protein
LSPKEQGLVLFLEQAIIEFEAEERTPIPSREEILERIEELGTLTQLLCDKEDLSDSSEEDDVIITDPISTEGSQIEPVEKSPTPKKEPLILSKQDYLNLKTKTDAKVKSLVT